MNVWVYGVGVVCNNNIDNDREVSVWDLRGVRIGSLSFNILNFNINLLYQYMHLCYIFMYWRWLMRYPAVKESVMEIPLALFAIRYFCPALRVRIYRFASRFCYTFPDLSPSLASRMEYIHIYIFNSLNEG